MQAILLFDGVCNLCNATVRFLVKHDRKEVLSFAWLQSETGQVLSRKYGVDALKENSFILLYNDRAYTRSSAALQICRLLGGGWKVFYVFRLLPEKWRDAVYDVVARYRYRWFGKKSACEPLPEKYRHRFRT